MSILTTSCHNNSNAAVDVSAIAETKIDVAYGKDPLQRMDIYLPAGRRSVTTKSLILIHGGGWNSGDKSNFAIYIDSFKHRLPDYAIFNINYRFVSDKHHFPAQENDVKAAIDFIAARSEEFQINKDKLVLLGASAGAHLGLLQAYKNTEPKIKAVVDFFGPTDLVTMYNHPWHSMIPYLLKMLTGTTPSANADLYKQYSPINFITPSSPPTIILHGSHDYVVDPSQSELLKKKLEQAGVVTKMIVYPSEGHGWYGKSLTDSFDKIVKFLNDNVR
jgi:acetyl esterase/lipase